MNCSCGHKFVEADRVVHRVLCGDCRLSDDVERLVNGVPINVAFTSPPYASQRKYDESSGFKPIPPDEYVEWWGAVQANVKERLAGDGSFFVNIKPACEEGERLLYVFDLILAMRRTWEWLYVEEFVWTHGGTPGKPNRRFKNQFEPVYCFAIGKWKWRPDNSMLMSSDSFSKAGCPNVSNAQGTGKDTLAGVAKKEGLAYPGNVIRLGKNQEALGHSAAFPVSLPSFFIKAFSDEGDLIFDPFLGSGTTLIACETLGRVCYGMEISPAYTAVILQRMTDAGLEPYKCTP